MAKVVGTLMSGWAAKPLTRQKLIITVKILLKVLRYRFQIFSSNRWLYYPKYHVNNYSFVFWDWFYGTFSANEVWVESFDFGVWYFLNSLHIKNSFHGIVVHSTVTKMQQSVVTFTIKWRVRSFCSWLSFWVGGLKTKRQY